MLEGARRLLAEVRPSIACEVAPQNARLVTTALHANGYRLFDASRPLEPGMEVREATWNTIAVPDGKPPRG